MTDAQLVQINEQQRLRSRAGGRPTEAQMDPRAILHEMRLFKDAEELDTMRRAAAITFEAHRQTALNGATLSFIFMVYTASSITSTFFICAATFVTVSIYGWTTKRDLTSMGGFMTMGLIGIIIASVVNMFFRSSAMSMIISYIGVIVFVGLTAYDTQHLKTMAMTQPDGLDAAVVRKGAILGALKLYLDFINLFLMLLRIFGGRR